MTKVLSYDASNKVYNLEIKANAAAQRMRKPLSPLIQGPRLPYTAGDAVEYFSESSKEWIKTRVVSYDASNNVYDLEIRLQAPANRVRKL